MLVELRVSNLGVIAEQTVLLGDGLTALTGETGAGKTLLVDAIDLLTGGPADSNLVSPGATEARVEGRFVLAPGGCAADAVSADAALQPGEGTGSGEAGELVVARVVPASGRSRSYVNGRMVPVSELSRLGAALVDIHGQHAQQTLLSQGAQRAALDRAGRIDTSEMQRWRREVRELRRAQAALGGDQRSRARELDLLAYQLREIDEAELSDPEEDLNLRVEEDLLADAGNVVAVASQVWEAIAGDGGVVERLGAMVAATAGRTPLAALHDRISALQQEAADAASDARARAESVPDDPGRLAAIQERRRVLAELRRKYGPSLEEVVSYRDQLRARTEELATHDRRAADLEARLEAAEKELSAATATVWARRREVAALFGAQVEVELRQLAMPRARFSVEVSDVPGEESLTWLLAANPGQPPMPLTRVASGGELSRAMLAARLVADRMAGPGGDAPSGAHRPAAQGEGKVVPGPATLVFDEVDAGIGGEAALAVGRALAALGTCQQVLVVTHLAQVAAFAGDQLVVSKEVVSAGRETTVAAARPVTGQERVVELARMLSGRPDSESARRHAEELLDSAGAARQAFPEAAHAKARGTGSHSRRRAGR